MKELPRTTCEWAGATGSPENASPCVQVAEAVLADRHGALHYSCRDHLSDIRMRSGVGSTDLRPPSATGPQPPEPAP
jgi:hypothetical protein